MKIVIETYGSINWAILSSWDLWVIRSKMRVEYSSSCLVLCVTFIHVMRQIVTWCDAVTWRFFLSSLLLPHSFSLLCLLVVLTSTLSSLLSFHAPSLPFIVLLSLNLSVIRSCSPFSLFLPLPPPLLSLPLCLCVSLSLCLSVCLSLSLYIYLSLSIYLSLHPSIYQSFYLSLLFCECLFLLPPSFCYCSCSVISRFAKFHGMFMM